jgi:multiple antibiotic resistance protein
LTYLEAILVLFAIVDPIGNIPMFLGVAEHVPEGQSQKAFNTAVLVGLCILLIFTFAGRMLLVHVFRIEMVDLQLAGGVLLLIISVDHLLFGTLKKSVMVEGTLTPYDIGCVPLACPLLAGPGAMVTCVNTLEKAGPMKAVAAILVVFLFVWLVMRFLRQIHGFLGKLFCTVFSKVMCLFIAAIGVHMIMVSVRYYLVEAR